MKRLFYSALRSLAALFVSGILPIAGLSMWVFLTPNEVLCKQPKTLIIGLTMFLWLIGSNTIVRVSALYEMRRKRMSERSHDSNMDRR